MEMVVLSQWPSPGSASAACSTSSVQSAFLLTRSESREKANTPAGMRDANKDIATSDRYCILQQFAQPGLPAPESQDRVLGSCLPETVRLPQLPTSRY